MRTIGTSRNGTEKQRLVKLAVAFCAALMLSGSHVPAGARSGRDARNFESVQYRPAGTPLMAIVALRHQRITIYDADGWILRAPISSGQTGYETPAGIYSVIQKEAEHHSNLYDDASMPFMQRITWSGIALHAGPLPGYAASHGCVRMPYEFARQLFDLTKLGMRVVVTRSDVSPAPIVHKALFKPKPIADNSVPLPQAGNDPPPRKTLEAIVAAKVAQAEAAAKKADEVRMAAVRKLAESGRAAIAVRMAEIARLRAQAQLANAERALEAAPAPDAVETLEAAKAAAATKLAETEAHLAAATADAQPKAEAAARAREDIKAAEDAKRAAFDMAEEARRRLAPVSVFISRKTQRLYVRQNFQPVLDTPVMIRDADQPIGTHIYTALDYTKQGLDLRWNVVSMTGNSERQEWSRSDRYAPAPMTDASAARAALDRIIIPQDAVDRISELALPGSSLIVSDEGISPETGNGTDFVILMMDEPHGAISMRRHEFRYD